MTSSLIHDPIYALEIYAPPSVDPAEATILTPSAGALHSDPFRVSTVPLAGYQPFLFMPSGRKGRVDVRDKKVDVGAPSFVIGDPRIPGLYDNLKRWLAQFLGDDLGVDPILRCKVLCYESLDLGGTWTRFSTSRVEDLKQRDDRISFSLTTKDVIDELINADIFVNTIPPSVASYAFRTPLMPVSLPQDWGGFKAEPLRKGIVRTSTGLWPRYVYAPLTTSAEVYRAVMIRQLFDLASKTSLDIVGETQGADELAGFAFRTYYWFPSGRVKVWLKPNAGAGGWFWLRFAAAVYSAEKHWSLDHFGVDVIDGSEGGMAFPAIGTNLTFAFYPVGDPTKSSPFLINDRPLGAFLKDLALGYFGIHSAGVPLTAVPIVEASFDAIAADPSFPPVRGYAEKRMERKAYMERLCKAHGLAMVPNGEGAIELVDFRPTYGWNEDNPIIEDADIAAGQHRGGWRTTASEAITFVKGIYYRDTQAKISELLRSPDAFPDPQGARITTSEQPVGRLNFAPRSLDFGFKPYDMDFSGFRVPDTNKPDANLQGGMDIEATVNRLIDEQTSAFGTGARYLPLPLRRNAKVEALRVGTRVRVQVSDVPDPLTKIHGGARAMIVIESEAKGPVRHVVLWDIGSYAEADPPTLTDPQLVVGSETECVSVDLALNALGEPAVVEYALMDPAALFVDPPETGWTYVGTFTADQTVTVCGLPSNKRVFLRARTEPTRGGSGFKLPSVWVYADDVVTDAYPAPSALVVDQIAGGSARVTWTNGSPQLPTTLFLKAGSWPQLFSVDALRNVDPGVTQTLLDSLTPSTTYTVGVAHPDGRGGLTDIIVEEFTTLAAGAKLQAPMPAGFDFYNLVPGQVLKLWAADQAFDFKIRRAPDTGANAPNVGLAEVIAEDLPGSTNIYIDPVPGDGTKWWYELYHTRPGYLDSDPLPWKAKVAKDDPAFGINIPPPQPVMPTWSIATTNDGTTGTMTVTLIDPESRVKRVEFQTEEQGDPPSAWTLDAVLPYGAAVPVTNGETARIRVRFIGNDANGLADQVLGQEERTFPGRQAGLGPSFVFHTTDDVSYPNARVLADSDEIELDVTTARTIKLWLTDAIKEELSGGGTAGTPGDAFITMYAGAPIRRAIAAAVTEHFEGLPGRFYRNVPTSQSVRVQGRSGLAGLAGAKVALQYSALGGVAGTFRFCDAAQTGPFFSLAAIKEPALGDIFPMDDPGIQGNNRCFRWVTLGGDGTTLHEFGNVHAEFFAAAAPPPSDYPDPEIPLTGSLLAAYLLDEGSGQTVANKKAGSGGLPAMIVGSTTSVDGYDTTWATGPKRMLCPSLAGFQHTFCKIPDIPPIANGFAYFVPYRVTAGPGDKYVAGLENGGGRGRSGLISMGNPGVFTAWLHDNVGGGGGTVRTASGTTVWSNPGSHNVWFLLGLWFDGTYLRIVVNGVVEGTSVAFSSTALGTGINEVLHIGWPSNNLSFANGADNCEWADPLVYVAPGLTFTNAELLEMYQYFKVVRGIPLP